MNTFKFKKSTAKYYDKLVENELNDIDTLILMELDDLNEYNISHNKLHKKRFIKIVNDIKIERNIFIQNIKDINKGHLIELFDNKGIYTMNEYRKHCKTVNDINRIVNDLSDSKELFAKLSCKQE